MTDSEKEQAQNFMKKCKNQKFYSTGKSPPEDGKSKSWMNSVIKSPEPLTLKLESLDNLDSLREYLKSKPEVLANIKTALKNYCAHLKSQGAVSTCEKPSNDPPFPQSKFSARI